MNLAEAIKQGVGRVPENSKPVPGFVVCQVQRDLYDALDMATHAHGREVITSLLALMKNKDIKNVTIERYPLEIVIGGEDHV